jgi:hypothetical protein
LLSKQRIRVHELWSCDSVTMFDVRCAKFHVRIEKSERNHGGDQRIQSPSRLVDERDLDSDDLCPPVSLIQSTDRGTSEEGKQNQRTMFARVQSSWIVNREWTSCILSQHQSFCHYSLVPIRLLDLDPDSSN